MPTPEICQPRNPPPGPPSTKTDKPRQPWSRAEMDIVSTHYPQGGKVACQLLLPHRSLDSIRAKAYQMNLHISQRKRPVKIQWTPWLDGEIRAAYANPRPGVIKAMAARLGLSYAAVRARARILGCCVFYRTHSWTESENQLIETYAYLGLESIRRKLAAAGYQRSLAAIQCQLYRLKTDHSDIDRFNLEQLAKLCGVNGKVVGRWVNRGWLKAEKQPARFSINPAEPWIWTITRKNFLIFLRNYPSAIDLRKVDGPWFIEVTVGLPLSKK